MSWLWRKEISFLVCLIAFQCADDLAGTPKGVGQVVDGDVMKASCFVGDECIESWEVKVQDRKDPDGNPW
jgi:hypothetical protein